jgi:MFS family permease
VVWYAGQFYAMYFLTQSLKVDATTVWLLIAAALVLGTPFFVVFGWLSDRIGRKKIIMAGCLIAALTYFPLFKGLTHYANPAIDEARASAPAVVVADPKTCSFQFDPVGKKVFSNSCDIATAALAKAGVPYSIQAAPAGTVAQVKIGATPVDAYEGAGLSKDDGKAKSTAFVDSLKAALTAAGYPEKADPARVNKPMVLLILTILVIYVTMVYGPIAAWLVELFPTKIRYTSMSLPYHIGNGWFGGFLPTIAFALVAGSGNMYQGLWYPIIIAAMTFVVGSLFLRETKDVDITQ